MAKAAKKIKKSEGYTVVKEGHDPYGRRVRYFTENGEHFVAHNRNGAYHPVKCEGKKEAEAMYKAECESHE